MTSPETVMSIQTRALQDDIEAEPHRHKQEDPVPQANANPNTLPGVTPPQGDMIKYRCQPGSARRGTTPAPNLKSNAL